MSTRNSTHGLLLWQQTFARSKWQWCPSDGVGPRLRHNIQVWAGQLYDRSGGGSIQGTGGASGESGQDVVWISSKSVQCAVTRTGWLRW